MSTRADRIYNILLKSKDNRLKVSQIIEFLQREEQVDELHASAVTTTVRQDNQTKDAKGESPRFNHSGDGTEERGYVSIKIKKGSLKIQKSISEDYEKSIPEIIEKANEEVKNKLKKAISNLTWQEFEDNFLEQILNSLGFTEIQLTQRTRDGGKDAECQYKRGLVESKCIVSAKHWSKKVGPGEVQRLRGIKGDADTAIIITSNNFSDKAIREAKPSQNQRSIFLIDMNTLVDICFEKDIGVKKENLQTFKKFTGFDKE